MPVLLCELVSVLVPVTLCDDDAEVDTVDVAVLEWVVTSQLRKIPLMWASRASLRK